MTETTRTTAVEKKTPELLLPDAASTAETIVHEAVKFCADKLRLGDYQMVVEKLSRCDESAANYCHYSIAKQIGEALGALDSTVQAVYMVDYDATSEDICFGTSRGVEPIHVIIRVERWWRRSIGRWCAAMPGCSTWRTSSTSWTPSWSMERTSKSASATAPCSRPSTASRSRSGSARRG
jgi:hypothetical protein